MRFAKGHGTENDFVVLPDLDGELELTARLTAALCDRRAGIGADGVLRVVRTAAADKAGLRADVHRADAASHAATDGAEWFMDYRNADGSIAEMCGNGIRVFVRWLVDEGLAGSVVRVATRGGTRVVSDAGDGLLRVDMGVVDVVPADAAPVRVATSGGSWEATAAYAPNPHAVAFLDDSDLEAVGPLSTPPVVTPADAFPEGVNVEFVVGRGPRHVAMRVHERGSGETRSCGTGVCAVAAVAAHRAGETGPSSWTVDVPGGRLSVDLDLDLDSDLDRAGRVALTGPAVIVAEGELDDVWVKANL